MTIRPVQSTKHGIDVATSAAAEVQAVVILAEAVPSPNIANTEQVNYGSSIPSVYMRIEVLGTGTFVGVPRIYFALMKNPGNNLSIPNASAVGASDSKKFVMHQEMTMVGDATEVKIPRTMFQGVIRIPPRYRRFAANDRLLALFTHAAGETSGVTNACIQCIYKEYQ